MLKVELLYFEGCPNYKEALQSLKDAMRELQLGDEVDLIEVINSEIAIKMRFLGSPSIRIDGKDIEHAARQNTDYSMKCRRYNHGSELLGYPPREMVVKALQKSLSGTS